MSIGDTPEKSFSPGQGTTTVPRARTTTTGSASTSAADALDRSGAARQSTRAVNATGDPASFSAGKDDGTQP